MSGVHLRLSSFPLQQQEYVRHFTDKNRQAMAVQFASKKHHIASKISGKRMLYQNMFFDQMKLHFITVCCCIAYIQLYICIDYAGFLDWGIKILDNVQLVAFE